MQRNRSELPSEHIGMRLRSLREVRHMSRLAVVEALGVHGYHVTAATYAQMEAGGFLVDDCEAFLDAYEAAMCLRHEELVLVVRQLAYDLLRGELGEDVARQMLG